MNKIARIMAVLGEQSRRIPLFTLPPKALFVNVPVTKQWFLSADWLGWTDLICDRQKHSSIANYHHASAISPSDLWFVG